MPVIPSIVTITACGRKGAARSYGLLLEDNLVPARFLARVNRFLALVELEGRETSVHVANSGRLHELFLPGARVWLKPAAALHRKTSWDLALVEANGVLVSADTRVPNTLVAEAASQGMLAGIPTPSAITRESTFGESRFDLLLEHGQGRRYVEVKSVSLVENEVGLFPDSPTVRGAKHLDTLAQAVSAGHRASVVFVVQRPDARAMAINDPADPVLSQAFRNAVSSGVEPLAYNCHVSRQEIRLDRRLPIVAYDSITGTAGRPS